ncbi:MAG: molybdopterin molybdotransferase [Clostridiales bacterium]|jgi:putative molybdopterin biosynthesis protein|nr:molybdopterin molybdotransferase [Clostridiales bacterium]MDN5297698.1 molybdopterin molybdotransferase [Clostridiales bacterium]
MKRNVYISNIPIEEALAAYREMLSPEPEIEYVPIRDSLNRVTASAVKAVVSSPSYHCAAMDGIAVKSADTFGASERLPKKLTPAQYVYVNTGNPMPKTCDAVIMIEDVVELAENCVQIIEPAHEWQHVRVVGEDIAQGEMIITSQHRIRPVDLGALISAGIEEVPVYARPRVGILPTGSEIVERADSIQEGFIIDSNSSVIEGLALELGALPKRYAPVPDDYDTLKTHILKALSENDLLLVNAGSSAGTKDFTAKIIEELGEVMIHGIALKPGKPTILGNVNGKGVIGLPGYPVSAYFAFETFVKPMLETYLGFSNVQKTAQAVLTQRVVSSLKHEELVRVTLGSVEDKIIATPLNRGAGATMSLVKADGIVRIPRHVEGLESGTEVTVDLMRPLQDVMPRIVVIGSHDIIIDDIQDKMPLASSHVGSMGGIMALKRGECHLAPIHLLDEKTGEYNIAYLRRYFPAEEVALIEGVKRLQGLIVKKGNPKGIETFEDLTRDDVIFVNRQRGSGTRQLLDYQLKDRKIDAEAIAGYTRELTTHLGVAVAVASEGIDVGLGVYAAAKAMNLDFIPLGFESYDFAVRKTFLTDERCKRFVAVLASDGFADAVEKLGGYALENPGRIKWNGGAV